MDHLTDIIDDTLRSLSISGAVMLREHYVSPWAISIPDAPTLAAMAGAGERVQAIAFHLVELGHCRVTPQGGEPLVLKAGEIAINFGGQAHSLGQGALVAEVSVARLLQGDVAFRRPAAEARGEGASLLCGVFLLRHTEFNPLFAALPSLLRSSLSRPGEMHNLAGVARLMAEEIDRRAPGGGYIVERLLEVLCSEAIRAHIESAPPHEAGWIRGIKDPVVGRAIAAIHTTPGEAWSVPRLAADVAISPSRFAARFAASVGISPMAYVARLRMNIACRALSDSRQSVDRVASEIGYDSPAAFSRAFKKHLGVSPAEWRGR